MLTVSALADFDVLPGGLVTDTSGACRDDEDDTLANFSNYGSAVDIAAPGVCILSTYPLERGEYGTISGTSVASPMWQAPWRCSTATPTFTTRRASRTSTTPWRGRIVHRGAERRATHHHGVGDRRSRQHGLSHDHDHRWNRGSTDARGLRHLRQRNLDGNRHERRLDLGHRYLG